MVHALAPQNRLVLGPPPGRLSFLATGRQKVEFPDLQVLSAWKHRSPATANLLAAVAPQANRCCTGRRRGDPPIPPANGSRPTCPSWPLSAAGARRFECRARALRWHKSRRGSRLERPFSDRPCPGVVARPTGKP